MICAVVGCSNSQKKLQKWKSMFCEHHPSVKHEECPCLIPFSLHSFPKNEALKRDWISAINRKCFTPGKSSKVCSVHFLDGKPTSQNPVPQLQLGYQKSVVPGRRPLKRLSVNSLTRENKFPASGHSNADGPEGPEKTVGKIHNKENVSDFNHSSEHTPIPLDEPSCSTVAAERETVTTGHSGVYPIFTLKKRVDVKSEESQTSVITDNKSCQYPSSDDLVFLHDHNYFSPARQPETVSVDKCVQVKTPSLTVESLSAKDCLFYTGLTTIIFRSLLTLLEPSVKHFKFQMPLGEQLLLVLMRLRLALLYLDLGRRFGCSSGQACKIFISWLPLMAAKLENLICWLPRETIKATMPKKFKALYPRTTCILDCTEVFIRRPSFLRTRAATYSNYKHHNTLKFLVATSPAGFVMFISKCYGGRASDPYIVNNCGVLDHIVPGDEVMADRGFPIDEELWLKNAKLNVPSFTKGRSQLSETEVTATRRIASLRVHVERAIARIKYYRILKSILPLDNLNKTADYIVTICAALSNLQPLLIKDSD